MGDDSPEHVAFVCTDCDVRFLQAASGAPDIGTCPRCGREIDDIEEPADETLPPADDRRSVVDVEVPGEDEPDDAEPPTEEIAAVDADLDPPATVEKAAPRDVVEDEPSAPTPEDAWSPGPSSPRDNPELRETTRTRTSRVDRVDMSRLLDEDSGETSDKTVRSAGPVADPETSTSDRDTTGADDVTAPVAPADATFPSTGEIRDAIADGTYQLRVDDTVYGPLEVDDLVPLVERGLLIAADAISDEDGSWLSIAEHPALARLREKLERGLRDHLGDRTADDPLVADSSSASITGNEEDGWDDDGDLESDRDDATPLPPTPPPQRSADSDDEVIDRAVPSPHTGSIGESIDCDPEARTPTGSSTSAPSTPARISEGAGGRPPARSPRPEPTSTSDSHPTAARDPSSSSNELRSSDSLEIRTQSGPETDQIPSADADPVTRRPSNTQIETQPVPAAERSRNDRLAVVLASLCVVGTGIALYTAVTSTVLPGGAGWLDRLPLVSNDGENAATRSAGAVREARRRVDAAAERGADAAVAVE